MKPSNHSKMCFVFATRVRKLKQISKLFWYYTIQWPFLYKLPLLKLEKIQTWILKKIQIYPHKQHYQNARFRQISTAKFTTWYMDSAIKMVFYRKSKASPIVLWNKIFGQLKLRILTTEHIYGTCLKFMTFELIVVFMNTRDDLNNSWNYSLNATLSSTEMICSYSICIFCGHLCQK